MVKVTVHRLALLMASTTYSIWGGIGTLPSRALASGDAKLVALVSMACGQLWEKAELQSRDRLSLRRAPS